MTDSKQASEKSKFHVLNSVAWAQHLARTARQLKKNGWPAFKTWLTKYDEPKPDPVRERRENIFFNIIGIGGTVICAALLVFWGEDIEGSKKALQEAKIAATDVKGFDKDSRNCNMLFEPYRTQFNGVAADGKKVSGVVCKSYLGSKRVVLNTAR